MEPPAKRARVGQNSYDDSDDEANDDELSLTPGQFDARQDPMYQLDKRRAKATSKLKSRFEHIFEKYEQDLEDVSDEINLHTGEVEVNHGHLQSLQDKKDREEDLSADEEERILQGKKSSSKFLVSSNSTSYNGARMLQNGWQQTPGLSGSGRLSSLAFKSQEFGKSNPFSFGSSLFGNSPAVDPAWQAPEIGPSFMQSPFGMRSQALGQSGFGGFGADFGIMGGFFGHQVQRRIISARDARTRQLTASESAGVSGEDGEEDDDDDILMGTLRDGSTDESPARPTSSDERRKVALRSITGLSGTENTVKNISEPGKDPTRRPGRPRRKKLGKCGKASGDAPAEPTKNTPARSTVKPSASNAKHSPLGWTIESRLPKIAAGRVSDTKLTKQLVATKIRKQNVPQKMNDLSDSQNRRSSRARKQTEFYGQVCWLKKKRRNQRQSSAPGSMPEIGTIVSQLQEEDNDISYGHNAPGSAANGNDPVPINVDFKKGDDTVSSPVSDSSCPTKDKDPPTEKNDSFAENNELNSTDVDISRSAEENEYPQPGNNEVAPESGATRLPPHADADESQGNKGELVMEVDIGVTVPTIEPTDFKGSETTEAARESPVPNAGATEQQGFESSAVTPEIFTRNQLDPSYAFSDDENEDWAYAGRDSENVSNMGTRPLLAVASQAADADANADISEEQECVLRIPNQSNTEPRTAEMIDTTEAETFCESGLSPIDSESSNTILAKSTEVSAEIEKSSEKPRVLTIEIPIRGSRRRDETVSSSAITRDQPLEPESIQTPSISSPGSRSVSPDLASHPLEIAQPHTPRKHKPPAAEKRTSGHLTYSEKKAALASLFPDNSDDEDEISILSTSLRIPTHSRTGPVIGRAPSHSTDLTPRSKRKQNLLVEPEPHTNRRTRTPSRRLTRGQASTDSRAFGSKRTQRRASTLAYSSPLAYSVLSTPRGKRFDDPSAFDPQGTLVKTPGGTVRRCGIDGFVCDRDFCFTCCK